MDRLLPELCGSRPLDPLPVWEHGSIGYCFNELVLSALPHLLLALSSACYVGTPRFHGSEHRPRLAWKCRITVSFLFAVLAILSIILEAVFLKQETIALEVLTGGISALAWITHGIALFRLHRSADCTSRGPLVLVFLVLLPVPSLVIKFVWYSHNGLASYPMLPEPILELIVTGLQLACVAIYLLAFLAPVPTHQAFFTINDTLVCTPILTDSGALVPEWQKIDENNESWLSRLFFHWMNPLLKRGYHKDLKQPDDVYHLPYNLQTQIIRKRFNACWQKKNATLKGVSSLANQEGSSRLLSPTDDTDGSGLPHGTSGIHKEVSLFSVLISAYGLRYFSLGIVRLLVSFMALAGPLLLNRLVNFMETRQEPLSYGLLYAFGLFTCSFLGALLHNQFEYEVHKLELMVRAAAVSTIYRKAVRANSSSLSHFSMGEVVNFISTDSEQLTRFCFAFHEVWILPIEFAVTFYLLYQQVGLASLAGLGLTLLLMPVNKWIATLVMNKNCSFMEHKDTRLKLMTEILRGIQVIKFYAWEKHFADKVKTIRDKELRMLTTIKYMDAVCSYLWDALPLLLGILIFTTYVLLGHQLSAATVFTTLSLIDMLMLPLNLFPWMLTAIVQAKVSLDRIERFLQVPDQDVDSYYITAPASNPELAIEVRNATFSWSLPKEGGVGLVDTKEEQEQKGALEIVIHHLAVKEGSLVGVVGRVGCGKSSLLAAITGELNRKGGYVFISNQEHGFGFVAQEPWIQFATVRENILFGKSYNDMFYQEVIEACALTYDLSILPAGDQTEVGENGVTLSGGQKARVALARAIYQDKEIYLLDDPLSAVDADVASHLLEKCILGILRHKTRILCTHRTEYLSKADYLILMDEGKIIQTGTPSEILPLVEASLKHSSKRRKKVSVASSEGDNEEEEDDNEEQSQSLMDLGDQSEDEEQSGEHLKTDASHHRDTDKGQMSEESGCGHNLIDEEEKKEGLVSFLVYRAYSNAVGTPLACAILCSFLFTEASRELSAWWLSHWVSTLWNQTERNLSMGDLAASSHILSVADPIYPTAIIAPAQPGISEDLKFNLIVYGCIAAANSILTLIRGFMYAYGTIRASLIIHDRLLQRVLKATVTFFNTTPMGRIINRFSSDLYCADDDLPLILSYFLTFLFSLMGMVVMISYGLPWIILVLVPLAVLYFYIQQYYRHTSRELKRLCSITLSPIYTHFSETLTGLTTIRATRATSRFEQENEERLERNQRCKFVSNTAMQWLDIRLQMMGVIVITAIAVIGIIQHQMESGSPGLVGLALTYALFINIVLSQLISYFTRTETMMVSMERIEEYSTEIPKEPEEEVLQVASNWPTQGQVEFQNALLAYRPGLPNALDGVNFTVSSKEKVGIVGRTGSGKSTMFMALFRMMELEEGHIFIDNINIRLVGLQALRSKLAIIPQDPFLFSGTIRENLDPRGRHQDAELFQVLEQCHLKEVVVRMGGLSSEVGEQGKNFSVGQRQLLCLARALLTDAKVLCIDEATASVDQKTDQVLQQTIRERFADKTVLTIAHRLDTIMDSDRVLVMQAGKVVEMGSPQVLSNKEDSAFYRLVHGEQL
ncbi:ATP-binding cassette sub-family C member 10-like isoform X2 [Pleurodeles waltl]|uniref:ATP-binding cassette sub-family C member 10-like isoform X2 n=1 Tax=Pleurodeles waltl TaxID=8319 RepID=UPI003709A045